MKKIKLASILLAITLALTAVPFFATADNAESADITIENFDGADSVITASSKQHASISEEYAESGTKSLKLSAQGIDLSTITTYYWTAEINPTNKNSGDKQYMRFWLKNTTGNMLKLDFAPNNGRMNSSNAPYYLENSVGDVWTKNAFSNSEYYSRGTMRIPAGFTGYVYIPKDSFSYATITTQMRFITDVRELTTGALYIDSISFTDNLPALNLHVNFDDGEFNFINKTNPDAGIGITDEYSYSAGKSLKFGSDQTAVADAHKGYCSANLQNLRLVNSEGEGIALWVNNTADNDVHITAGLSGTNGFTKSVSCYLEDNAGDISVVSTVDSGYYGYRAVKLPANFEGRLYIPFEAFASGSSNFSEIRLFVRQADLTGALYADSVVKYFETPTANLCENFDYNGTGYKIENKTVDGFAAVSSYCSNSGKNSLKLTAQNITHNNAFWTVDITTSYKPTAGDGLKLWVKNSTGNSVKFDIAPNNSTALKVGSISYLTKDGKNFFLSRAKQNTDNYDRGVIIIPAGFEGFVYIPLESFNKSYSLSYFRIQLDKTELANGALYVDSIGYYSGYEHNVAKGDCNYDGTVDIRDLVKLNDYIAGTDPYADFDAADVDTDYKVNADDISALRKKLLES